MSFLGFNRFDYEWKAYKNSQTIEAVVAYVDYAKSYKSPSSTEITYKYYDTDGQLRWKRESISNLVKTKNYKGGDVIQLYRGRDGKYFFIDSKKHVYESFFIGFTSLLLGIFCIFVTIKQGRKFWLIWQGYYY